MLDELIVIFFYNVHEVSSSSYCDVELLLQRTLYIELREIRPKLKNTSMINFKGYSAIAIMWSRLVQKIILLPTLEIDKSVSLFGYNKIRHVSR